MTEEELTVVYWRDIPAQVIVGKGRDAQRIPLPDRFQQAIDRAATRAGLIGSDDYMAEWRKVPGGPGNPSVIADQLDADLPDTILDEIVRNHGKRS